MSHIFSVLWSLGNQIRCVELLLIITKPSTTKWAYIYIYICRYTNSSSLTCNITRHTTGGILPHKVTNLVFHRNIGSFPSVNLAATVSFHPSYWFLSFCGICAEFGKQCFPAVLCELDNCLFGSGTYRFCSISTIPVVWISDQSISLMSFRFGS